MLAASDGYPSAAERTLLAEAAARMGLSEVADQVGRLSDTGSAAEPVVSRRAWHPALRSPEAGHVYLQLMAAMATIDGEVDEREVAKLATIAEFAGSDPQQARTLCGEAMVHVDRPLWFLEDVVGVEPDLVEICLRDMAVMADANGECGLAEQRLLEAAGAALGRESVAQVPRLVPVSETSSPSDVVAVSSAVSSEKVGGASEEVVSPLQIERAFKALSATAILAGGGYVLAGKSIGLFATITAAFGAGVGVYIAAPLIILAAGVGRVVLQIVDQLDGED